MRQVLRPLVIVSGVLLMAGCAGPAQLGLSSNQWQSMNESQRQKLVQNYKKAKKLSHKKAMQNIYNGPDLLVYLDQGKAMMPPFTQSYRYQTQKFKIRPGKCRSVTLHSIDTENEVDMDVCYNGLTLIMDPSRYDLQQAEGTLRLDYNPVWKRGFTYDNVSSQGYVRLKHANITVKAIPVKVPVENAEPART